jgi:hypothetical protein
MDSCPQILSARPMLCPVYIHFQSSSARLYLCSKIRQWKRQTTVKGSHRTAGYSSASLPLLLFYPRRPEIVRLRSMLHQQGAPLRQASQHTLVPSGCIMLFFADAEAGTSSDLKSTNTSSHKYSYIEHLQVTVYFNGKGTWDSDAVANNAMSIIAQRQNSKPA